MAEETKKTDGQDLTPAQLEAQESKRLDEEFIKEYNVLVKKYGRGLGAQLALVKVKNE